MTKLFLTKNVFNLLLVTALILAGTGCRVTKPTQDSTPPQVIKWTLLNLTTGNTQTLTEDNSLVKIFYNNKYRLTCLAKDPEGLYKISTFAGGLFNYHYWKNGEEIIAPDVYHVIIPEQTKTEKPDNDNKVKTKIFTIQEFMLETRKQPLTPYYDYPTFNVTCSAENFTDLKVTGTLKLQIC